MISSLRLKGNGAAVDAVATDDEVGNENVTCGEFAGSSLFLNSTGKDYSKQMIKHKRKTVLMVAHVKVARKMRLAINHMLNVLIGQKL